MIITNVFNRAVALICLVVSISTASAAAQTAVAPPPPAATPPPVATPTATPGSSGTVKIALINTAVFTDERAGLTRYIAARRAVDGELLSRRNEVKTIGDKLTLVRLERETLYKAAGITPLINPTPAATAKQAALAAKHTEMVQLEGRLKTKQDEITTVEEQRRQTLLKPLDDDLLAAINEYLRARGYIVVLDVSKLAKDNALLGFDQAADVTADFVRFYNARPVSTTTTTVLR